MKTKKKERDCLVTIRNNKTTVKGLKKERNT